MNGAQEPAKRAFRAIIIGAGPAGLCLAAHLSRLGVEHAVLERGRRAESWARMPPGLHLVSPWWTNAQQWRDLFRHWPFAMVAAQEYANYLDAYAKRHRTRVVEGCAVVDIRRDSAGGEFTLESNLGAYTADAVINATGYFSNPVGPEPAFPDDHSILTLHAARYPGAKTLKSICGEQTVLIIGRRISAGQVMVDLADEGIAVALSTRSPIEFRRDGFGGAVKDFLYYFYEELLLFSEPELRAPSFPVMDGGRSRQLVRAGIVDVFGHIDRINDGTVYFHDGRQLRPGAIVTATGYMPSLPDLTRLPIRMDADGLPACKQWQATGDPGFYFLGLDNRMNYRSRTIRGIRSDASRIAQLVKRQLG